MSNLLPCPFCGNAPHVDKPAVSWKDAWAHISCRSCYVKPMASGSCSTGYYERYVWVRTKTDEEAQQQSYEWAARDWNRRAP